MTTSFNWRRGVSRLWLVSFIAWLIILFLVFVVESMNYLDEVVAQFCTTIIEFEACFDRWQASQSDRFLYALTWWLLPMSIAASIVTTAFAAAIIKAASWTADGFKN